MSPTEFFMACYRIPYQRGAKILADFGAPMNCYGFVYWFYKLCLGIELEKGDVESFDNIECVTYNEVDEPQDGDVVWLKSYSGVLTVHVGIYWKGAVYHFTKAGLHCLPFTRAISVVKGMYHVTENTQRDIPCR